MNVRVWEIVWTGTQNSGHFYCFGTLPLNKCRILKTGKVFRKICCHWQFQRDVNHCNILRPCPFLLNYVQHYSAPSRGRKCLWIWWQDSFEKLESLWLSVSTDQQQLKHHCVIDIFFILNPKDSIIQATMKKVNPITARTRTHLKTAEGRSQGTEYLLEVLHLSANSIHV